MCNVVQILRKLIRYRLEWLSVCGRKWNDNVCGLAETGTRKFSKNATDEICSTIVQSHTNGASGRSIRHAHCLTLNYCSCIVCMSCTCTCTADHRIPRFYPAAHGISDKKLSCCLASRSYVVWNTHDQHEHRSRLFQMRKFGNDGRGGREFDGSESV